MVSLFLSPEKVKKVGSLGVEVPAAFEDLPFWDPYYGFCIDFLQKEGLSGCRWVYWVLVSGFKSKVTIIS